MAAKRKRAGRPAVPKAVRRAHQVPIYFTEQEKNRLEELAELENKTVSTFLRDLIFDAVEARRNDGKSRK